MRSMVIDHARSRYAVRRSPPASGTLLADVFEFHRSLSEADAAGLVALDEALARLAVMSARQAQVVEMRYFAGFTVEETADALGVSPKTVKREWAAARAWLHAELRPIER
jgi:RNA polymerase sigma factor (TIGR02999 family)